MKNRQNKGYQQKPSYFIKKLNEALISKKPNSEQIKYKSHYQQTRAALNYISRLDLPSESQLEKMKNKEWLRYNQKASENRTSKRKKTLVLDLDETLIHVSKDLKGCEFKIPVKTKGGDIVKVSPSHAPLTLTSSESTSDPRSLKPFTPSKKNSS